MTTSPPNPLSREERGRLDCHHGVTPVPSASYNTRASRAHMPDQNNTARPRRVGVVIGGSLTKGVEVKLEPDVSVEQMAVGRFVTIEGKQRKFFGVVSDVALRHTDERAAAVPMDTSDPFIAEVLSGATAFGTLHVAPYLSHKAGDDAPAPAKTVPPHFALVRETDPKEIELIFGANDEHHIWIGSPLDMEEAPVCLDPQRLTQRSTGVFGMTGSGKSFLTRILLAEIVQKSDAVSLIFDMHSEYGWSARSETGHEVKGLKQLFGSKVAVFTVDEVASQRRGVSVDHVVRIGYDQITADDVASLAGPLSLNEVQVQAAQRLERKHGRSWLAGFLACDSLEAIVEYGGGAEHEGSLQALHRKLQGFERFGFLSKGKAPDDTVARIMEYVERGVHVVLEFGRYRDHLPAYVLVANLLTRRLHELYVQRMERALAQEGKEPKPLVIVVEEAHKFLSPQVAQFTTFSTIARELRKYNVTLFIIDQRPGGIDPEVLSQIGTRMTCHLQDDRDIDAVLEGVSGKSELRAVLAKLETKQQALVFGHAVPMPVVVRPRTYDASFYRSVGYREPGERKATLAKDAEDLFGAR